MILSGSLSLPEITGSFPNDLPVGALFFEKDGTMRLLMLDKSNNKDTFSIMLVTDFFQYALGKPDWMSEFVDVTLQVEKQKTTGKDLASHLRLIRGGLYSVSGTNQSNLLN